MSGELSTPRVQPFYCPYCGEEDFVPAGPLEPGEPGEGQFHCRSCDRRFVVRFLGLGPGVGPGLGPGVGPGLGPGVGPGLGQEAAAWASGTP